MLAILDQAWLFDYLEGISLGDILGSRQNLKVLVDMQTTHQIIDQWDYVVYVALNTV